MRKLIEINISSLTPILLGGHTADRLDTILRAPSIKGLLRWWFRALIAGAAVSISQNELVVAKKITKETLGGTEGESSSSKVKLVVNGLIRPLVFDEIKKYLDPRCRRPVWRRDHCRIRVSYKHQRLNLLYMDLDKEIITKMLCVSNPQQCQNINMNKFLNLLLNELSKRIGWIENATITLYSYRRNYSLYESIIVSALVLALMLSGLGKGSRRGLGAIKIADILHIDKDIDKSLQDYLHKLCKTSDANSYGLYLQKLIDRTLMIAKNILVKRYNLGQRPQHAYPLISAIAPNYFDMYLIRISSRDIMSLWNSICDLNNKLFMRGGPVGQHLRRITKINQPTRDLLHFILGLPRSAGSGSYGVILNNIITGVPQAKLNTLTRREKTGFIYRKDDGTEGRRASPIILSAIDKHIVSLCIFKSQDWPSRLLWVTTHNGRTFRNISLSRAYSELQKILDQTLKDLYHNDLTKITL